MHVQWLFDMPCHAMPWDFMRRDEMRWDGRRWHEMTWSDMAWCVTIWCDILVSAMIPYGVTRCCVRCDDMALALPYCHTLHCIKRCYTILCYTILGYNIILSGTCLFRYGAAAKMLICLLFFCSMLLCECDSCCYGRYAILSCVVLLYILRRYIFCTITSKC